MPKLVLLHDSLGMFMFTSLNHVVEVSFCTTGLFRSGTAASWCTSITLRWSHAANKVASDKAAKTMCFIICGVLNVNFYGRR